MGNQGTAGRLLCLIPVLLGAVVLAPLQERTLRWKFEKGQSREFILTETQNLETVIQGNRAHNNFTLTTFATWQVTSVDQVGTAEVKQRVNRIKFQIASSPPGKDFEVDTADEHDAFETPERYSSLFRSIVGSEFTAKMTTRGEFRDVKVPKKLLDAYKQLDPPGKVLGDEKSLKDMFSRAVMVLPEAPVRKGTSWLVRRNVPIGMGNMVVESNHAVTSVTEAIQSIDVHGRARIEPTSSSFINEVKMNSQEQTGGWRFDTTAGVMTSSALTQKFSLLLKFGDHTLPAEFEWRLSAEFKADSKPR